MKQELLFEGIEPQQATGWQKAGTTTFRPGTSGHTGHAGSKKTLGPVQLKRRFVQDYMSVWEQHGVDALLTLAREDPKAFCQVGAALIPRQTEIKHTIVEEIQELSDEQLSARIERVAGEAGIIITLAGDETEEGREPLEDGLPGNGEPQALALQETDGVFSPREDAPGAPCDGWEPDW